MNKKGNVLGVVLVLSVVAILAMIALVLTGVIPLPSQSVTTPSGQSIVQQVSEATKTGDVSSLGVYVRDIANSNINTKVAVPVYCQDDTGKFIIDATSSSTSAEITGKTEIGRTVTCWAFNATYQTKTPATIAIQGESPHIVIDAYKIVAGDGRIQFYNDQYQTGSGGVINITLGADQTATFSKMRVTNNESNAFLPLAGVYFNKVTGSNVSNIDVSGSATLSGMDHSTAQIVKSDLASKVSTRQDNWDYVFEIDDNSAEAGNQALLLEANDYIESGAVSVTADGDGTAGDVDLISSYAFTKGYYRSAKEDAVKYGFETDAQTPAVITTDITGETFYAK